MAAPMEVAVCTDSAAQLWSCVVWELHSGANLLTYRGGQAGPRGLALLNGEYLLAAQLGKNYISAWELQRKPQNAAPKSACRPVDLLRSLWATATPCYLVQSHSRVSWIGVQAYWLLGSGSRVLTD
uniref:WD repeat-containing protein 18 n=1 Tax=Marmota marmota marmota TaxID=9994 RepID=A0A8C6ES80_MARMA